MVRRLRKLCNTDGASLDETIPEVLDAFHIAPWVASDASPVSLMFGNDINLTADVCLKH